MHSILAARSDFSIGESILTVEKLVDEAKKHGAKAVALVDTMSVTGMVDFSNRAKKKELKPIIGCRLRLVDDPTWRPVKGEKKKQSDEWFLSIYALTEAGLKAIFRLLTLANSGETVGPETIDPATGTTIPGVVIPAHFYYTAKLGISEFIAELSRLGPADLAVVLGDEKRSITQHPDFMTIWADIAKLASRVYLPLYPIDTPYFASLNRKTIKLLTAAEHHMADPIVLRPAYYEQPDPESELVPADAAEVLYAITENNAVSDPWHRSTHNRDFHLMTVPELAGEVKKSIAALDARGEPGTGPLWASGLRNTDVLVDEVSYVWSKQPVSLPKMADDEFDAVRRACAAGWKKRFSAPTFGHLPTKQELNKVYLPRLRYELEVLKKLNFSGYFLLVTDVVQFAKQNGILVGPGRGSVGGSLVAYLMEITECDPIRFDLLFERFINPDRIDLPDADLDFMSTRRHEIVDYLTEKFGASRVAGVSNFGTLAAASSIRDVGKAFGLPEKEYSISKLAPKKSGANIPLPQAREIVPEIEAFAEKYPAHWSIMERIEGTIRNMSQHAAGVIVGGVDLVERAVLERRKEGSSVVCWDKRIVEDWGLVKMDVLGLQTLDIIDYALRYIWERRTERVDLMRIPLDDKKVLDNFAQGNTVGIFQFESAGMRRLLKELGWDGNITFDDITAATALYRPGPMESGMMDSFFLRKQGKQTIEYDHPLMKPILEPTFGVMVYQEQVMQVSRVIAGYSAPDADKLRKIMGKKLPEEMKKERGKFVEGCVKTVGCLERWAGELFDKIEGFAGYGFNKSHSVEYTLISYQAMWLKTYYPVEFYAAALSLMDDDKLPAIIKDAAQFHIELGTPDINLSSDRFEIVTDTKLVIPFQRIKGVASTATKAILEARQNGPFIDRLDFLNRVEKRKCNKTVQEVLDKIGAFARIEPGTAPADDPIRLPFQIELLPGLVNSVMPVTHPMLNGKEDKEALEVVFNEFAQGITTNVPLVKPAMGKNCQIMLVIDAPNGDEENAQVFGKSDRHEAIDIAMTAAGLERQDIYWTGLLKQPKVSKQPTPDEINTFSPFLTREIELLKPPVILLCGTAVLRHFLPEFKGKASDAAGEIIYSKVHDANFVVGFNPGEIYYAPEKQELLNEAFKVAAGLTA